MSHEFIDGEKAPLTYIALWLVGTVAFSAFTITGAGHIGAFLFLFVGGLALLLHLNHPDKLFDNEGEEVVKDASAWTLQTVGIASGLIFTSYTALVALEFTTWSAWMVPIAGYTVGIFTVWGIFLLLAGLQHQ